MKVLQGKYIFCKTQIEIIKEKKLVYIFHKSKILSLKDMGV